MASVSVRLALLFACLSLPLEARSAINVPSDGSDGAFNPAANTQIDLGLAPTGTWSQNNAANAGKGVYDASKWAVVFKYSSVNIPAGVTVTFKNNATRAPVVWLVQGNVTVNGIINLDGKPSTALATPTEPGPGGFRGGVGGGPAVKWSGGFGIGGGVYYGFETPSGYSGSYATNGYGLGDPALLYGNIRALPLIGGSGQGGATALADGASGGGAILIIAGGTLRVGGTVTAKGGAGGSAGGGSGGAIRLVADVLTGGGSLLASGGVTANQPGGDGRIRLEANSTTMTGTATPLATVAVPIGNTPDVWPAATAPAVVVQSVSGVAVPADPKAGLGSPAPDVNIANPGNSIVRVQATNVPLNWTVYVRVTPVSGTQITAAAAFVSGTEASSLWDATVAIPAGIAAVQARARKP